MQIIFTIIYVLIIVFAIGTSFYFGYKLGKDKDYIEKLEKKIKSPKTGTYRITKENEERAYNLKHKLISPEMQAHNDKVKKLLGLK